MTELDTDLNDLGEPTVEPSAKPTQEPEGDPPPDPEPEPDPIQDVVDEFVDPLDEVPEDIRDHVIKVAQARFTKPQQKMADAVRAARAELEEARQRLEELQKEPSKPTQVPQEPQDAEPDPAEDPVGYLNYQVEKKINAIMPELDELKRFKAQQEQRSRHQVAAAQLEAKVPALKDPASEEFTFFNAWCQHPDNSHRVQAYENGLIGLDDLYALATGPVASQQAVVADRKKLAQKVRGRTSAPRPPVQEPEVSGWDDIDNVIKEAARANPPDAD